MNEANEVSHPWMANAWSRYLLAWEQQRCDEAVADIFGYHSLQLGLPVLHALRCNRMPHQWVAAQAVACGHANAQAPDTHRIGLYCDPQALPFAENSLDLLVLPHTLEHCTDPGAALREAVRVLVPEGRLLLFGLNPLSLWGIQHALERRPADADHSPNAWQGLPYWRVRDWLQVLAMEVQAADFGGHVPALQSQRWLDGWRWMDPLGQRLWPVLGGAYCMLAVKKVHGTRLLEPRWRSQAARGPGVAAAACQQAPQRKAF